MNIYHGKRGATGVTVTVQSTDSLEPARPLDVRLDLVNHSPDGFEWGYNGSGPAQLALAIMAHELKDEQAALAIYQEFRARVIAFLPQKEWELTGIEVQQHAANLAAVVRSVLRPVIGEEDARS